MGIIVIIRHYIHIKYCFQ